MLLGYLGLRLTICDCFILIFQSCYFCFGSISLFHAGTCMIGLERHDYHTSYHADKHLYHSNNNKTPADDFTIPPLCLAFAPSLIYIHIYTFYGPDVFF